MKNCFPLSSMIFAAAMTTITMSVNSAEIKDSELIAMGTSKFVMNAGDLLSFKGRFKSDRAYKNNLYVASCYKPTMTCWITTIDQIAPLQIVADSPKPFNIKRWTKDEVLVDDGNDIPAFICEKSTITINLKSNEVTWFFTPVNQHEKNCQSQDAKVVTKMTLENSLSMEKYRESISKQR